MILLPICLVIKKVNPIVTEIFIRGRKLNVPFLFVTQSYFALPKPPKNESFNKSNQIIHQILTW